MAEKVANVMHCREKPGSPALLSLREVVTSQFNREFMPA